MCRGHAQYPAFAPDTLLLPPALQKWQLGFLVSLYLFVHNLPQLHRHEVIFSPLYTFFIFCYSRRHLGRCKHCSKGSQVPGLSLSQLCSQCVSLRMAYFGTCAQTTSQGTRDDSASRHHSPSQIPMLTVQKLCRLKPRHTHTYHLFIRLLKTVSFRK